MISSSLPLLPSAKGLSDRSKRRKADWGSKSARGRSDDTPKTLHSSCQITGWAGDWWRLEEGGGNNLLPLPCMFCAQKHCKAAPGAWRMHPKPLQFVLCNAPSELLPGSARSLVMRSTECLSHGCQIPSDPTGFLPRRQERGLRGNFKQQNKVGSVWASQTTCTTLPWFIWQGTAQRAKQVLSSEFSCVLWAPLRGDVGVNKVWAPGDAGSPRAGMSSEQQQKVIVCLEKVLHESSLFWEEYRFEMRN